MGLACCREYSRLRLARLIVRVVQREVDRFNCRGTSTPLQVDRFNAGALLLPERLRDGGPARTSDPRAQERNVVRAHGGHPRLPCPPRASSSIIVPRRTLRPTELHCRRERACQVERQFTPKQRVAIGFFAVVASLPQELQSR